MTMTAASAITSMSATEIAGRVRGGDLTVTEVTDAHIARIEEVNPKLNAVVVPLFDQARKEAREADAGRNRSTSHGPLFGVPVTIKECFDVAGAPSMIGVTRLAGHRAAGDAPLVARLRQAGAIVLGKTNVAQMLLYVESDNPVYGRTNNPWNTDRSAGGSSGGEGAIIAAYGTPLGLGTDIGGSIRVPAHFNGIQGLKPTPGRLCLKGSLGLDVFPGNEAIPDAAGPLARHVADLKLAMSVLGAPGLEAIDGSVFPVPLTCADAVSAAELRVGFYDDDGFFPASAAMKRAVREAAAALQSMGATVEEFRPPDVHQAIALFYGLLSADGGAGPKTFLGRGPCDPRVGNLLNLCGMPNIARPLLGKLLRSRGQHRVADLLPVSGRRSAGGYLKLVDERRHYRERFALAMDAGRFDVLICPPNALPAFTHGAARDLAACSTNYTMIYNLLAMPAGVVAATRVREDEQAGRPQSKDKVDQAARTVDSGSTGLPVGVQVIARRWREDLVLATMAALEAFFTLRPDYPARPPV